MAAVWASRVNRSRMSDWKASSGGRTLMATRRWSRSSRALSGMAQSNGAEYLHVFQPNQYLEGSKPLTEKERDEFYRPDVSFGPAFRATYPCFESELTKLAADEWLLDESMLFERETETVYSDWCCHFNEYGLRKLATSVAREIVAGSKHARAR